LTIEFSIGAVAEQLSAEHSQLVPIASLTVLVESMLEALSAQGVTTSALRAAAEAARDAYLARESVSSCDYKRAVAAIRLAGLALTADSSQPN